MALPFFLWGKTEVFARLVRRFKLLVQREDPDAYLVRREITPVTQVDELLRELKQDEASIDLSGAGYVTAFTVPAGKRWRVWWVSTSGSTGASAPVLSDGAVSIPLSLAPDSTAVKAVFCGGVPMDEGHWIGMSATGQAGDNARGIRIRYEEEDAYQY